ncbi:hypothetical protein AB205_0205710, partial [Aquarana catesbeiana]
DGLGTVEEGEDQLSHPRSLYSESDGRDGAAVGGSVILGVGDEEEFRDTIQLHYKEEKHGLRYFVFEGMRYIWNERSKDFIKVRKLIYGQNEIDVPVKSYGQLLIEEILNPFYIFQLFSVVLWFCEQYYYYAVCIIIISFISVGVSLYETKKVRSQYPDSGGEMCVTKYRGVETEVIKECSDF